MLNHIYEGIPEPQHLNWDLRSSKEGFIQTLFEQFLTYFQNIGVVALEF